MSNVVSLHAQRQGQSALLPAAPALIELFAFGRRDRHDAYWLKENAELLQILAATGARPDVSAYGQAAATLADEMQFFPQYYRLYLSLALDLAALGLPGVPVAAMAAQVVRDGLIEAELSDAHRGEAHALLRRAGVQSEDPALRRRLECFAGASHTFALPNRRAGYDLTHYVFHATDYGRSSAVFDTSCRQSLINAGLVAWLDDDLDLLAEITIALRLAGMAVPPVWDTALQTGLGAFGCEKADRDAGFADDYHAYFVMNWAQALRGGVAFDGLLPDRTARFHRPATRVNALREVSLALLDMGSARGPDWGAMRWRLWPRLSEAARNRLSLVEDLPEFAAFFSRFSRSRDKYRAA